MNPIASYADLMTLEEFVGCVKHGAITDDDGIGFWATETDEDIGSTCWTPKPDWATHVAWYSK
jgi:hypothetical protein